MLNHNIFNKLGPDKVPNPTTESKGCRAEEPAKHKKKKTNF